MYSFYKSFEYYCSALPANVTYNSLFIFCMRVLGEPHDWPLVSDDVPETRKPDDCASILKADE